LPTAALIVAAGRGTRASADGRGPKQYAQIRGRPVLAHTLAAFSAHPGIDMVQVVIHADDGTLYETAAAGCSKLLPPVTGGATRQASVRNGLEVLTANAPARVLIHDAARPFVTADVIDRVLGALYNAPGAIAADPVADTLKRSGPDRRIVGTVDRAELWRAQTPQGFAFEPILAAHRQAAAESIDSFTDDAALAEWAGLEVVLALGSSRNVKLTTVEDMDMAERMMGEASPAMEPRIGQGFDVHRFTDGDAVWLCGVKIAHDHALLGHSDADVGLHALTDAILGAIGDGDIGQHFPPSDPKWKGAASHLFVEDAARRVAAAGGRIVNVDVTILAEAPRVGPHRDAMRAAIGAMLDLAPARVGIKATTTEELGFTGRREGIAAMAVASVLMPVGG
jgi:2-C-methyl-D-erythritol 4-phosphate cytidylyltransferase / 2-C-methyl-D-erythritol 2,4-cyclodiphosphate synthase